MNFAANNTLAPVVNSFTLKDSAGTVVSTVVLASSAWSGAGIHSDEALQEGSLALVPVASLPAGTYTATVSVTLKVGTSINHSWSFSTYDGIIQ